MRELRVGGATRAVAASGAMVHSAREMEPFLQSYDVSSLVRVTSIEILAQPREDHRDRWQTGGRR